VFRGETQPHPLMTLSSLKRVFNIKAAKFVLVFILLGTIMGSFYWVLSSGLFSSEGKTDPTTEYLVKKSKVQQGMATNVGCKSGGSRSLDQTVSITEMKKSEGDFRYEDANRNSAARTGMRDVPVYDDDHVIIGRNWVPA
jgi:hypothetical protein